ncbi:hypothetical protein O1D97_17335 [Marinomonas sp. 15G1-11]|uniref:Flagellar hook-length control protein FliK n=1 Tax=Marinomonas phaeophyticola TaxID=3004091 RepID=A0ABT4JY67_9GAMM|nr:hypothetical protein [Marinomonas sp. 15G1-11]MCZ2723320.1 hypothetical protein [Marinomonas sp. 15G1-11]
MMFDISKLNSQSSTTLNSLQGQTTKELSGPLAKLSSELKLIASLESIKINSTRDIIFQQKPAQILDVSTKSKQNFNLINTQQKIEVQPGDTVELQVQKNSHRAILSLVRQNAPPVTTKTPSPAEPSTSTLRPENTNTGKALPAITQNSVAFSTEIQKNLQSTLTTNSASNFPSKASVSTTSNGVLSQNTSSINSASLSEIKLSVNIISKTIPLTVLSVSQIAETTTSISNKLSAPTQTTQAQSVPEPDKNVTSKNASSLPSTPNAINQPKLQQVMTNNLDPSHQKITMDARTQPLKTSTQEPSFLVEVNDGEDTFTLKTQHRPEIGSKIAVMIDPKGQVQLVPNEMIQRPSAPIEDGLKVSLPKQLNLQEMTQFIKQLETLSQSSQLGSEKIQQTLAKLIANIPTLSTLTTTPEALKHSVQQSGLFLENNLAKELPEIEKDMKLNLLKLQAAVSETSSAKLPLSSNRWKKPLRGLLPTN